MQPLHVSLGRNVDPITAWQVQAIAAERLGNEVVVDGPRPPLGFDLGVASALASVILAAVSLYFQIRQSRSAPPTDADSNAHVQLVIHELRISTITHVEVTQMVLTSDRIECHVVAAHTSVPRTITVVAAGTDEACTIATRHG